ncbi:MAG: hypothetical protein AAFX54_12780 [Pseudomonadota bacterium]
MLHEVPIRRERIRWALACYQRNQGTGLPTLYNQIVDVVGEEVVDGALTLQDLYNFLRSKVSTREWKLDIIQRFLESVAPEYIRSVGGHNANLSTADAILRFVYPQYDVANDPDQFNQQAVDLDRSLYISAEIEEYFDPDLERPYCNQIAGLKCTFLFLSRLGTSPHLEVQLFGMFLTSQRLPSSTGFCLAGDPKKQPISDRRGIEEIADRTIKHNKQFEPNELFNLNKGILVPTPNPLKYIGISKNVEFDPTLIHIELLQPLYSQYGYLTLQASGFPEIQSGNDDTDDINPFARTVRNFMPCTNQYVENFIASMQWGF